MTPEERDIMDSLVKAWNSFTKLISTHPNMLKDFADGIHKCQDQLIHRIVQRDYPEDFPICIKD